MVAVGRLDPARSFRRIRARPQDAGRAVLECVQRVADRRVNVYQPPTAACRRLSVANGAALGLVRECTTRTKVELPARMACDRNG